MKAICFYFQVHQPFRLRKYRFFDIGKDHYYYDDYTNESIMRKVAEKNYLPANELLLRLIKENKDAFKVSFSLSGLVMDQMKLYSPETLDSFRKLADTGQVEFLAETNAHSLAALVNKEEFVRQVEVHKQKLKHYLGVEPTTFRGTELIYSDEMGEQVYDMGFRTMLTEGAKHVLGWKSPNFLYCNARNPKLKVLLRNFTLSDDIAFRFSNKDWNEWPLTAEKFANWLNQMEEHQELANIFIDYETFGEHQPAGDGIFDFLGKLPEVIARKTPFRFMTPTEISQQFQTVGAVQVPYPVSWADEERDLTAWLGNNLQESAFEKLYSLAHRVMACDDKQMLRDWDYLQSSDHFYYMSTKFFSDGDVHAYFNPYQTPYDAFMNYMNILSDFEIRLNACAPEDEDQKLALYVSLHQEREEEAEKLKGENRKLKEKIRKMEGEAVKLKVGKKAAASKARGSRKTVSKGKKGAAGTGKTEKLSPKTTNKK